MYLDFAELQATRRVPMRMAQWVGRLAAFLQSNEYEILTSAGKVSHEIAKTLDKIRPACGSSKNPLYIGQDPEAWVAKRNGRHSHNAAAAY